MSKRPGGALSGIMNKKQKSDLKSANDNALRSQQNQARNPFLSRPIPKPEDTLGLFLIQARSEAKRNIPKGIPFPITKPFCEIEARLGILKSSYGPHDKRVLSSGPKQIPIRGKNCVIHAFDCSEFSSSSSSATHSRTKCQFEGGVTRTNFLNWTMAGLSEVSAVSSAFGILTNGSGNGSSNESAILKRDLMEMEMVETVYGGLSNDDRLCFKGDFHPGKSKTLGKLENKSKLTTMDMSLPAAPYDLRLNLSTERTLGSDVREPPREWSQRRLKRRRSYRRKDNKFAWQLDTTEVTTTPNLMKTTVGGASSSPTTQFEIEMELDSRITLQLINEQNEEKAHKMCKELAGQLWWMLSQINPSTDVLGVEECLRDHPNRSEVQLALAQCGSLKKFMDGQRMGGDRSSPWISAIAADGKSSTPSAALSNIKFPGCMPVNFSRPNIEQVQRSDDDTSADGCGYYLSEKTDGVRHFMVFTGKTVVLVDRAMEGKQVIPRGDPSKDPMESVISLIKPGTVLDGEVVMHRKLGRSVFIVFDVLSISATEAVLHQPFSKRLQHLKEASFRTATANRDMFDKNAVLNPNIALPLVRKNFVKRMDLDNLLSNVVEEKGLRSYRNGDIHNHLTDGIIFQPNLPYVCGTDMNLLKWKYLDTVTIDVQIKASDSLHDDDNDKLHVEVLGEEGSMVDMTRFIHLPASERRRLEADRSESGSQIAEVGLEPSTGEWYYLTMRPDKVAPNHISTVLGSLMELAECLSTEELRYRMSVHPGSRDTYRKELKKMQKQLLDFQRDGNKKMRSRGR